MYVFVWSSHIARVCSSIRLPILLVVSKMDIISLSPLAPEKLVSRDGFGSPAPLSTLKLNLVLTYGIPPDFRGGIHLYF